MWASQHLGNPYVCFKKTSNLSLLSGGEASVAFLRQQPAGRVSGG